MRLTVFRLGLLLFIVLALSGCAGEVNGVPEPRPASRDNIETGRYLIAAYGCGSCHTVPGVPGADGMSAPPLNHFYERGYIAGVLPNTEENLVRWIQDPQKILPGNAMPSLGVTAEEARQIAAYLYNQPNLVDLLSR